MEKWQKQTIFSFFLTRYLWLGLKLEIVIFHMLTAFSILISNGTFYLYIFFFHSYFWFWSTNFVIGVSCQIKIISPSIHALDIILKNIFHLNFSESRCSSNRCCCDPVNTQFTCLICKLILTLQCDLDHGTPKWWHIWWVSAGKMFQSLRLMLKNCLCLSFLQKLRTIMCVLLTWKFTINKPS